MVLNNFISSVTTVFNNWRKRKRGAATTSNNEDGDETRSKKQKVNYTITPVANAVQKKRYCYYIGEELCETESRSVEYKAGGCLFVREQLEQIVQKYACAFLNAEGGTLLAGVNDAGIVNGVSMGYEDWKSITYTVERELERFRPVVPRSLYSLKQ